jgi:hypothetical protein
VQTSNSPNIGWEEHVYESNDIQLQACPDWVISTTGCCRNSRDHHGLQPIKDFYLYIQVNTQAAPVITPRDIVTAPLRSYVITSPSASIPAYQTQMETTSCLDSHTAAPQASILPLPTTTTCNGTCSGLNPLPTSGGTSINSTNGTVCLTPNATAVGPVCLLIEEYRGGTKIGEYLRDMQIHVQNCTGPGAGNPPQASAINGTLFTQPYNPSDPGTYTYVTCVNQNFCFTINFRDPDNQNVTVLPPTGLPARSHLECYR